MCVSGSVCCYFVLKCVFVNYGVVCLLYGMVLFVFDLVWLVYCFMWGFFVCCLFVWCCLCSLF